MSQPPNNPAFGFDPANELLCARPARLFATPATAEDGSRILAVTIRTESTTLTVMLTGEDAMVWANIIKTEGSKVAGPKLIVPKLDLNGIDLKGMGQQQP